MNNPYSELIEKIDERADSLVRYQIERDHYLVQYEKQKVLILILILSSAWIMFYLLWTELEDAHVPGHSPSSQHDQQPHDQMQDGGPSRGAA